MCGWVGMDVLGRLNVGVNLYTSGYNVSLCFILIVYSSSFSLFFADANQSNDLKITIARK